jgi:hypothetical protein
MLLKKGDKGASTLLGYNPTAQITVSNTTVNRSILKMESTLDFSFTMIAQKGEKLVVDYLIDFVKANGTTKPKVFKLKVEVSKGETVTISKSYR